MSEGIISSSCLLLMKHIKNLTEEIIAMVLGCCHYLSSKDRENLLQWLISYVWRADKNYGVKRISDIETKYFPNLEEERRVMDKDIPLGFEGDRQYAREMGLTEGLAKGRNEGLAEGVAKGTRAERERLALSLLHAGVDVKIICNATEISQRALKKLKKKFEQ